jgi:hypothetical protein
MVTEEREQRKGMMVHRGGSDWVVVVMVVVVVVDGHGRGVGRFSEVAGTRRNMS